MPGLNKYPTSTNHATPARNAYVSRLRGNTILSFSGSRTRAYMLRQVLDHNEGLSDLLMLFANTGKDRPSCQ